MNEKRLPRKTFAHEGLFSCKGERREEDRRSTNGSQRFSKTLNFNASSNFKEAKQTQSNHCLHADGTHKKGNCPLFRNMSAGSEKTTLI